jgi:hypothetical protein
MMTGLLLFAGEMCPIFWSWIVGQRDLEFRKNILQSKATKETWAGTIRFLLLVEAVEMKQTTASVGLLLDRERVLVLLILL